MENEMNPSSEKEDIEAAEENLLVFRARIRQARAMPEYHTSAELREMVAALEKACEDLEAAIATKISDDLLEEIQEDKAFSDGDMAFHNLREQLIIAILDTPGNEDLIKMARQIIGAEKLHDLHNPEDWKLIAHLIR